jgi:acyl-CoA thioester hydrolase
MQKKPFVDHVLKVPFYDVDSMEVVWHGHYIKYFEQARCAFLDELNYNYEAMRASGYVWPVVDLRAKYIHSAKFNQWLRVRVALAEYENRLKLDYVISDRDSGEKLCSGYSVQVAVCLRDRELQFVLPDVFRKKAEAFVRGFSEKQDSVS